jgi:hypothetical protein
VGGWARLIRKQVNPPLHNRELPVISEQVSNREDRKTTFENSYMIRTYLMVYHDTDDDKDVSNRIGQIQQSTVFKYIPHKARP